VTGACRRDTPGTAPRFPAPGLHVYALHYGVSTFREKNAIDGGGKGRVPFGWYAFLVTHGDHRVLVDTGFESEDMARRFGVTDRRRVDGILATAGLPAEAVTDVVLTHGHWDHVGGVHRYPRANLHMAGRELDAMATRVSAERPDRTGYRWRDLERLRSLGDRLGRIAGEARLTPHVRIVEVGGHTPGALAVVVEDASGPKAVLASDNAYLYRNIEEFRPIPKGSRVGGGADALPRLRALAGESATLVPGHDPELMKRYPGVAERVARLY